VHPAIWFEVGSSDSTLSTLARLDLLARAHGFDTRFVEQQQASHSFASWSDAFHDALPWIASSFGTPQETVVPGRA